MANNDRARSARSKSSQRKGRGGRTSPAPASQQRGPAHPDGGKAGSPSPVPGSAQHDDAYRRFVGLRSLLNPLWCYYGFRVAVIALTCFGVIMVFSSSSVTMISQGASPWRQALSQGIYCVLGLVLAVVAAHVPMPLYRRMSLPFVGFSIALQLLTLTPLGVEINGNVGWIGKAGVFTLQPAEVIKLALCIWLPTAMAGARKLYRVKGMKAYAVPSSVFFACILAVMLGKDLGTAMVVFLIGAVGFIAGGFPMKWFAGIVLVLATCVGVFVALSPNRLNRVLAAYRSCTALDAQNVCYQAIHAKYAMASGGLLGVGIGNSREKWNYLPAAHNDFIFAIIGEEMGFVGAALVILLFAALGWCMVCVALQTQNRYVSIVLMCITVWIVGQAMINIMVVVGLLPVMGLPMPFVSAGGSSLIMCLIAAGVAMSMMRSQPQINVNASAI